MYIQDVIYKTQTMEAKYYSKLDNSIVKCMLCPHNCIIGINKTGKCKIRKNIDGELVPETYQKYSSISFDPIEKKPLYHYFPGSQILSLGSLGCNMSCNWCQNCEISQKGVNESPELIHALPEQILKIALSRSDNIGVSYTYNEPLIAFETIIETATLIKKNKLKNVMVSNGYFSQDSLNDYLKVTDAFNIDVKAFDSDIYMKYTGAKLQPVLDSLIEIKKQEKHLELTYLVVPGVNDNLEQFKSFINWIEINLGRTTILHISKYFPRYKMKEEATDGQLLDNFATVAANRLYYVYLGNYFSSLYKDTKCPVCKKILVERLGYSTIIKKDVKNGCCPECEAQVFISD